ncbi:hypothetical protein FACS189492_1130 [Clostridia bacterium]|nr:hypothetical protein FACS189492_1130 [Clostridia bacterium]
MYKNKYYELSADNAGLLRYAVADGETFRLGAPVFEVDGQETGRVTGLRVTGQRTLNPFISELTLEGTVEQAGLRLLVRIRVSAHSPVVRFSYALTSDGEARMTKTQGRDNITYLTYQTERERGFKEIRFSEFNEAAHSYVLNEVEGFAHEDRVMGPMLTGARGDCAWLMAYEHGSQYPNRFIEFVKRDDRIEVKAVKGNYYASQAITSGRPYETIWFQFGAVRGDEDALARQYRTFVLNYFSLNAESRKPYIFYNTWARQERDKWWRNGEYHTSMNLGDILEDIDAAHKIGVEVFVLDVGWFNKTGDWAPHPERFPDQFRDVKARLDGYGMKLGLWFDPKALAVSSELYRTNERYTAVLKEQSLVSHPGSEPSHPMCLVSDYWSEFADRLIHLSKELGVTYFKWDAIEQYGCTGGGHNHGTDENSVEERYECCAFSLSVYLSKIVDQLCAACPEVIVDFDVTEGKRCFGLGFLSSGKYFVLNNGPYCFSYDIPKTEGKWSNVFVYPGQTRARVCRTPLDYDKWLPSVLLLTHYLPDDPENSQLINLASLILGQNGIWGDLTAVSDAGIALFNEVLTKYKSVRYNITKASLKHYGRPGGSLEVYEKINPENGKGAVVIFGGTRGRYQYRLSSAVHSEVYIKGNVEITGDKLLCIDFSEQPGAAIVLFG